MKPAVDVFIRRIAPVTFFHEEQRFRASRLWLVIAVPLTFAVLAAVAQPDAPTFAGIGVAGVVVALVSLVALARLETTVTNVAVVVRFHALWPTRRIPLTDITEYAPVRYRLWDSGGWGVHFGFAGMTYNASGNEGVRFILRNGAKVLIGTQRPQELALAVAMARRITQQDQVPGANGPGAP